MPSSFRAKGILVALDAPKGTFAQWGSSILP